jgi:hypothetical protein
MSQHENSQLNPHVLFTMEHLRNPAKFSKNQIEANRDSARSAYVNDSLDSANYAAGRVAEYANEAQWADSWINEFFKRSGDDIKSNG